MYCVPSLCSVSVPSAKQVSELKDCYSNDGDTNMVEEILKSKLVNFLVSDAQVDYDTASDLYSVVESGDVDALADVMEAFRNVYGGLWVGGGLTLTHTMVRLHANALNRLVQDGTLDIEIPLSWVRKVSVEGGFLTKIVRLDTDAGSVKFRCYGAKDVASMIEKMALSPSLRHAI